jgi:hypothetical protein
MVVRLRKAFQKTLRAMALEMPTAMARITKVFLVSPAASLFL